MAVAMKSVASSGAVRPARRTVKCQAGLQKVMPAAIATVAAASLIASPAFAGVILQQPELKKVFQENAAPAAAKPAAETSSLVAELPKPKKAPAPKVESSGEGGGIDAQLVALPLSLVAIGGGYFALSKLDEGFADTVWKGAMKDSNIEGVGYEVALKAAGGPSLAPKSGTKKVKAGTKKGGLKLF